MKRFYCYVISCLCRWLIQAHEDKGGVDGMGKGDSEGGLFSDGWRGTRSDVGVGHS